jgi:hypothetical protein
MKPNALKQILQIQLIDFDQLFLEEPKIPDGALGIMATISIIVAANRRER